MAAGCKWYVGKGKQIRKMWNGKKCATEPLDLRNLLFGGLGAAEPRFVHVGNRRARRFVKARGQRTIACQVPEIAENLAAGPVRGSDAHRLSGQRVHFRIGMLPAVQAAQARRNRGARPECRRVPAGATRAGSAAAAPIARAPHAPPDPVRPAAPTVDDTSRAWSRA